MGDSVTACANCGKPLPKQEGRGRRATHCSGACRQASHKRRHAPALDERRAALHAPYAWASALPVLGLLTSVEESKLSAIERELKTAAAAVRRLRDALGLPDEQFPPSAVPAAAAELPRPRVADEPADSVTALPTTKKRSSKDAAALAAPVAAASRSDGQRSEAVPARAHATTSGGLRATVQQEAIVEACRTGKNIVVEAGAGSGKTSTLRMAAESMSGRGLYTAFNKPIVEDAKRSFPATRVSARTTHSLAYGEVGVRFKRRIDARLRMNGEATARQLGLTLQLQLSELLIGPALLAHHATATVEKFCQSADDEISFAHVPRMTGVSSPSDRAALADTVLPIARQVWADGQDPDGKLAYKQSYYVKLWALGRPRLKGDFVFVDEGQDIDPVVAKVMRHQQMQVIVVGDSAQQIYTWRGAINSLATFPAEIRLALTKAFRFGPAGAAEANRWLAELALPMRLTGNEARTTRIAPLDLRDTDAVLCRTNAEAMRQVIHALDQHRRPAIVGGTSAIKSLAESALLLQEGRAAKHPELAMFKDWNQVREYTEHEAAGADLRVLVKLIDDQGAQEVLNIVGKVTQDERRADLVVSTAHKAKGREWDRVKIATDFREPRRTEDGDARPVLAEEARLAYVAVTRAREVLDNEGLRWIHQREVREGVDRDRGRSFDTDVDYV